MKLTIIRADGCVYKDGYSYSNLDLHEMPLNIHALQFNDVTNAGWIEFVDDDFGMKEPNELIIELPEWAKLALVRWEEANQLELIELEKLKVKNGEVVNIGLQNA